MQHRMRKWHHGYAKDILFAFSLYDTLIDSDKYLKRGKRGQIQSFLPYLLADMLCYTSVLDKKKIFTKSNFKAKKKKKNTLKK